MNEHNPTSLRQPENATETSRDSPTEAGGVYRIAHSINKEIPQRGSIVLKLGAAPALFASGYSFFVVSAILSQHTSTFEQIVGVLLASAYCSLYLALLVSVWKNEFILHQWGITLPAIYLWSTKGKLTFSWMQLEHLTFMRTHPQLTSPDQIVLYFRSDGAAKSLPVAIRADSISQLDLKKLIYAIVSNAAHAPIEPPLNEVELVFPTVKGIKHLTFQNFTSLWDEEFSTRYAPTLFVPLAPEHELREGAIKITELVACGGSAAIYAATGRDGTKIIVKEAVIPKNANELLRAKAVELFKREALLLSKLDHPNIAKVIDHFVESEHHYEVIEFIDGLDLRRFVKERGPQPEDFVLNWGQQICQILVYLHSQEPPVIHRDLTPDNLVLRVDAKLVLIDFGAANAFVGTATGTMVGKQSYMPPEQLRGKAVPQSDIYSLGGTLYFLLTGHDPTPLEPCRVSEHVKVSQELESLIARCTAIELADRYQSTAEVLEAIARARRNRLVEATPDQR